MKSNSVNKNQLKIQARLNAENKVNNLTTQEKNTKQQLNNAQKKVQELEKQLRNRNQVNAKKKRVKRLLGNKTPVKTGVTTRSKSRP